MKKWIGILCLILVLLGDTKFITAEEVAESQLGLQRSGWTSFKITAYCSCPICCGKWSGLPLPNGDYPQQGRTIATDRRVILDGTTVHIMGLGIFLAEDSGSAVKGNHIDVYFDTHDQALAWGMKYMKVRAITWLQYQQKISKKQGTILNNLICIAKES